MPNTQTSPNNAQAQAPAKTASEQLADMARLLDAMRAENAALKDKAKAQAKASLKVSDKGGVSLYGMGRFPITLYHDQWERVLGMANEIREFIADNRSMLKSK
jgi:hypothetical protein